MGFDSGSILQGRIRRTAPCPVCATPIHWGDAKCFHCSHVLSATDIQLLKQYMSLQRTKELQLGLNILPIGLVLLFWLFLLVN